MSLWQDDNNNAGAHTEAAVCDVHFRIDCKRLPVDHAYTLSQAVFACAPWLNELTGAAVHPVHVAASQNGWERPGSDSSSDLLLSRRTRLKVRVDSNHADQLVDSLRGQTLSVDGNTMKLISGKRRALTPASTLFSRYVCLEADDEAAFIDAVVSNCNQMGYQPTKLLCGKSHSHATPQGLVASRSVLFANVPPEFSLRLQETGIGDWRKMGCGLIIPHKDTGSVEPES